MMIFAEIRYTSALSPMLYIKVFNYLRMSLLAISDACLYFSKYLFPLANSSGFLKSNGFGTSKLVSVNPYLTPCS